MAIVDRNDGDVLRGSDWQSVIDTVESISSGHDHDGVDSKAITVLSPLLIQTMNLIDDSSATLTNYRKDAFSNASYIDQSNSTCLWETALAGEGAVFFPGTVFDRFTPDGSVDSSKWSTSGSAPSYSSNKMVLSCSGNGSSVAISNGTSGLDFKSFSGNSEIVFAYSLSVSPGNGDGYCYIQFSDGSSHVDIASVHNTNKSGTMRILVNKSAGTFTHWDDDGSTPTRTGVSISGLSNWYLRFAVSTGYSSGSPPAATANIYPIGYSTGGNNTTALVTTALPNTNSLTIKQGIADLSWGRVGSDSNLSDTGASLSMSSDNGSNYTTASLRTLTATPNTGTSFKVKLTLKEPSSISTTNRGILSIGVLRAMWLGE